MPKTKILIQNLALELKKKERKREEKYFYEAPYIRNEKYFYNFMEKHVSIVLWIISEIISASGKFVRVICIRK